MDDRNEKVATPSLCGAPCWYWVPIAGTNQGECHRYPPVPVRQLPSQAVGASDIVMQAAVTTADYWCGEFK
jgi:hypothetical protein